MASSRMGKQAKGGSSKDSSRATRTGKSLAGSALTQKEASSASKKVIEKSAERHRAALTRLADR